MNARFERLKETPTLNGIVTIDYLERTLFGKPHRSLLVEFVRDLGLADLKPEDVEILGGDRITSVQATNLRVDGNRLTVTVDRRGDFSSYFLQIVPNDTARAALFDPIFRERSFSFRAACPTDADCHDAAISDEADPSGPELDYRARDYATFRRTMLDRMSTLLPDWTERNAADLGVAVVETLAYVADRLAYRQDAVATEAYLATARSRISVRRHARLVDYWMHDGRNARTFVHFRVASDLPPGAVPKGTPIFVRTAGIAAQIDPTTVDPQVTAFEAMEDSRGFFVAHNALSLHDWGLEEATIAKGATSATLLGALPDLKPGDWLLLREARGPRSGDPEDADPAKRHPVRIVKATPDVDPLATPTDVVRIEWHPDDALPFDLCLSHRVFEDDESRLIGNIAAAVGNLVPADHGRTQASLPFDPFRPSTFEDATQFVDGMGESAHSALHPMGAAIPALELVQGSETWSAQSDLFKSDEDAPSFVLEVDDRGRGHVRFGDGVNGRLPVAPMEASFRVGGGPAGNVPVGTLTHLGLTDARIESVTNPLPGIGGEAPESSEHVRQAAPFAYRTNLRAVTEADYAEFAGRHPEVQRAVARYRWTGSWRTIFVLVDRRGGKPVDRAFRQTIVDHLEPFRMAGHDLEVRPPTFLPLLVELEVCVGTERFREDVKRDVQRALRPFFDPDRLTFGTHIALSPLVAAAQAVPGVHHVRARKFGRQNVPSDAALQAGVLTLGPLEVARLDDDPDFPERGKLSLSVQGGRA